MHAASASVVKLSCAEKSESFEYVNNRPGVERGYMDYGLEIIRVVASTSS